MTSALYKQIIHACLGLAVFFVFTGYVFLNARLKDTYGDMVMLVILLLALPRISSMEFNRYGRFFAALFWAFLALTLASVLFPPSSFAKFSWLVIALYRLVFSAVIIIALCNLSDLDRVMLRWGLAMFCLMLAVGYICEREGLAIQEALKGFSPLKLDKSDWHDKNYAFWQLLLMWGSVSLLWRHKLVATIAAIFIMVVSTTAIFLSSSESSQLAAVVSIAIFIFANVIASNNRYKTYSLLVMSAVLGPILWVCFAPVKTLLGQFIPRMEAISIRVGLYDYTASLIKKELVLGYGFGSTLFMPIPQGVVPWQFFPGGHTHNLVLQFFIDHGLLGLVFISTILLFLFHYLYHALKESPQAPAVWALLISGLVLFSLSYAIWYADIVLMYCMWLALIFAVSSRCERREVPWLTSPLIIIGCLLFGVTSVACYAVDYLFLAGK